MALRPSMSSLIARVQTLIADPTATAFTPQQCQDALDLHRTEQRYIPLRAQPTFSGGGTVFFLDYYSNIQNWADDIVLQDTSYTLLTPTLSENIVGHWAFGTQPGALAVRATGKTYDIYAAAADLLESWAAQVKLDFSVSTGTSAYQRQQKFTMMMDLAKKYRMQAMPQMSIMSDDYAAGLDATDILFPNMASGQVGGS